MSPLTELEDQNSVKIRRVWLDCAVFVLLLAVAAGFRIPRLFDGISGDEVYTLAGSMWPLDKLLSGKMAATTFTPLTWLVVKATIGLFPPTAQFRFPVQMPLTSEAMPMHLSEATLRIPFFFMSLLTLVVLFLLVRKYFGLNAAFWAGLFLAISPEHIYYSDELRFYGMVCLAGIVLLSGVQLVLDNRGWRGWAITALGLLLGLPTHLSFFFVTAGIMGGAALSLLLEPVPWRRRIRTVAGLAGLCAAVVVLQVAVTVSFSSAPLDEMRLLFGGHGPTDAGAAPDVQPDEAMAGTDAVTPVKYTLWLGDYVNSYIVKYFLSCHDARAGVLLAVVLSAGLLGMHARRRSLLLMLLGVLCSPLPLFFVQVNHKWFYRYFIFDLLLFAVLAGVGMDVAFRGLRRLMGESRPWLGATACFAAALVAVVAYTPSLTVGMKKAPYAHVDGGMKSMSEVLSQRMLATDRILFFEPFRTWRLSYHLIPYYLCRLRPDWEVHGIINKMVMCSDQKEFGEALAKQPRDGFWVVSFDGENKDPSLNQALKKAGGVVCAQYRYSSLWRLGGGEPSRINLLADTVPGVELPPEGKAIGHGAFRVSLPENSDMKLNTPTILFPVVREENGQPGTGLGAKGAYTLRFRLQLEDVVPGSNRTRMFRVMLFAKETTTDLMYAEGTTGGRDYEITIVPGEYLPETLTDVRIGFGIRGGTGAFRVDNVALQAEGVTP